LSYACDSSPPTAGWFIADAKASPNLDAPPSSTARMLTLLRDAVLGELKMHDPPWRTAELSSADDHPRLIVPHGTGMLCSISLLDEDGFASAGFGELAKLEEATEEHFDKTFNLNVRGTLFTVQKALPLFNDNWVYLSQRIHCQHQGLSGLSLGECVGINATIEARVAWTATH
jgi:NAD(P)-dependent dehydrogenase (short-subunit alcohol dehydrogenase family)